eukprot:scaffold1202_cov384-Prasinococcus_capsulatus_cf.AAC.21
MIANVDTPWVASLRQDTYAFRELLGGHGARVQRQPEGGLVGSLLLGSAWSGCESHPRVGAVRLGTLAQQARDLDLLAFELPQQRGADREQIQARQLLDLACATARTRRGDEEAARRGRHHLRVYAIRFVAPPDLLDGQHSRVLRRRVVPSVPASTRSGARARRVSEPGGQGAGRQPAGALVIVLGSVPVQDPAYEGAYQRDAGLGALHGLRQAEDERHVAVDALALQHSGRLDALPRGRQLH